MPSPGPRRLAKLIGRDGGELAYLAISDGAEAGAQEGRTDRLVYDGDGSTALGGTRSRATSSMEHRAEAGDCDGGVRTGCSGARSGASGRRDVEFDLPLAPGSAGGSDWLCSGADGTGWQRCRRTGGAGDRDRI